MARAPRPFTPFEEKVGTAVVSLMSALNTWVYRATRGRIGGRFLRGAPVLLLNTIGRKSGRPRTAPLLYLKEGDAYVIVASKGGMSHHPQWFRNLLANPRVEIELGDQTIAAIARHASNAEKAALWPKLVAMYPDYESYQARTTRNIPVVILTPEG
jgi:deazaflavin-dependent oxidoreductase (nitroreductase family)